MMELVSTRPQHCPAALPRRDAVSDAVIARYGDERAMMLRFDVTTQRTLALGTARYIAGGAPPFPAMFRAYGEKAMVALVAAHLAHALVFRGENGELDQADRVNAATGICDISRSRLLSMASVIGFFYRFRIAEYKIYGRVTPAKILGVYQEYADKAQQAEAAIYDELEARRRREADSAWASPDFAALCRRHGFDGILSPSELYAAVTRRSRAWRAAADLAATLRRIFTLIYNHKP